MTPTRRIILNVVATYGRSLVAMACGIFTSRWALMALGPVDYGLFGVVGGLTAFIGFINSLLAASVSRYYAFAIGQASVAEDAAAALEDCRRWFSIAVLLHTAVPLALVAVGYPAGVWAVRHFLTIPPDRVADCVWVFRFICLSCFVGMVNVPFTAMFTAKQYIAEMTAYTLLSTVVNVAAVYWMVSHPGDWLATYAGVVCVAGVLPQALLTLRGFFVFPECRFRLRACLDRTRIWELVRFTGWNAFGGLGFLMRGQGIAILVNKCFGPGVNASMAIANTVNGQAGSLSTALAGAFQPAITSACGAGEMDLMRRLTLRSCKFSLVLSLLFLIPLALELPEVLRLWLKNPPEFVTGLCLCMMVALVVENSTIGHGTAILATGRIVRYQVLSGCTLISTVPLAALLVWLSGSVYAVPVALVVAMCAAVLVRIAMARRAAGVSIRAWLLEIVCPVAAVSAVTLLAAYPVRFCLDAGFPRICVTTAAALAVFLPANWFILNADERQLVRTKVLGRFRRQTAETGGNA